MKLVLASGNKKKLAEFDQLLRPLGWDVIPQDDLDVPEAEETGLTFVENAILKARNACFHTGLAALADDSGLEVDVLKGAPGIYSSRFAGDHGNDAKNNALLMEKMTGVPHNERTARYQAVLVLMRHAQDPTPLICQGTWEGVLLDSPRGSNGFGYDPFFLVPELGKTAAELDAATKNGLSHRGKALAALVQEIGAGNPACCKSQK
jgi:XTP/dITP diphosphohydrolase